MFLASLITMTKNGNGVRELRSILDKYSDNRTWYRIKNNIKMANELLKTVHTRDWFDHIESTLNQFDSYKANSP